jgi:hypothetical protein
VKRERKRRVHQDIRSTAPQIKRPERPADRPRSRPGRSRLLSTGRGPQPPSWRRAIRRAPLFFLIMLASIHFLFPVEGATFAWEVSQALFFAVITIPGTYYADRLGHRMAERRRTRPTR